jgi:hypothetical protein
MLRILGSRKTLCDGLSRRDLLHAGALGLLGVSLGDLLTPRPTAAGEPAAAFGKAKACILLYLYGAPSQLETFDLKPAAPSDVRGDFNPTTGFDLAYSALLEDLESRGMLDETLVLCLSEHGRTPKLNNAQGGGREHWSSVYCGLFAGGGVRRGAVLGASDNAAGFPKDQPVSPKDVLRTVYHLLGVDAETHLKDREGRPVPLVSGGKVIDGLLA